MNINSFCSDVNCAFFSDPCMEWPLFLELGVIVYSPVEAVMYVIYAINPIC